MERSVTAALRTAIVDALYSVSATMLADVCEAFGMASGTREEAFSSKKQYVSLRLLKLPRDALLALALRVQEEYPSEELERALKRTTQSQPADSIC